MTLIEFYLRKYLKVADNNALLEFRNYLLENNYKINFDRMIKNTNQKIYLKNGKRTCKVKFEEIIDDDERIIPSIIMVEKETILDEESPFNHFRAIKDINYRLDNGDITVYYSLFPEKDISNGYWTKIYTNNNQLLGEIVYPEFMKIDLDLPYIKLAEETRKHHILLTTMTNIVSNIPATYFSPINKGKKERINK